MKLSILILTHNRPQLFQRCIKSVLTQIDDDIEVIVNNDSNDIEEVVHPGITYHYEKFDNLSSIYKFLLEQARGKYVYFLEDDDYIVSDFTTIDFNADIIAGNYYPTYHPTYMIECMHLFKNQMLTPDEFIAQLNLYHLQLSQFIMRRNCLTNFEFTPDNNIYNDIKLILHAASHAKSIETINKILFYQTIDGGDNISFPESNHSVNTSYSLDFLQDYKSIDKQSYSKLRR